MHFWLMKSEPSTFSFDDLLKKKETFWDGVRNYQARNFMRDKMKVGDKVLFYHSNTDPIGIVGLCEVVKEATPDLTALDVNSPYYDKTSTPENIRWCAVTVGKPKKLKRILTRDNLKNDKILSNMLVLQKGQRLSILPVTQQEFERIYEITK